MVGRILRALFYLYIKQKAKQTLKRRDNSSSTMSLQKDLTMELPPTTIATSSVDTTEKIIMAEATTEQIVSHVYDWAMGKIQPALTKSGDSEEFKNAMAIANEFEEWIDAESLGIEDIEIMSIERY
jgi:hypothetical protein